ncbi:MAG: carboxypeptidase-like regulatory domain-containing protein, partial [Acidobacteriota bacterium]|nr:carboxypeptidase-like regulatory domain-containing protein [Acidobacteriota bacterium]
AGQIVPGVDFSLTRGARFTGTVTDSVTRAPVAGVSIAAYDADGNATTTAVTDAAGNYSLVVPAGTFTLIAFDAQLRYVTAYSGGAPNYQNSSLFQADWNSSRRVDFTLSRGIHVSGTVVDPNLRGISGVQVDALDLNGNRVASATTIDGTFDLILKPDTYKLLAADPLQRFRPLFFNSAASLGGATPVVVQSSGVSVPLTFILARADRRHATPH